MKQQCKAAIYLYVDQETQNNAALTGEHKEYVQLVLQLMRDSYREQVSEGATQFVITPEIDALLTAEAPW